MRQASLRAARQILLLVAGMLAARTAWSQTLINPVRLAQTQTVRGDLVVVTIDEGPTAESNPRMTLERGGDIWEAEEASYTASTTNNKTTGSATGRAPMAIPLGDYLVTVYAGKHVYRPSGRITVQPVGSPQLSLAEFTPDNTYEVDVAQIPVRWTAQPTPVKLSRLKLLQPLSQNARNELRVFYTGRPLEIVWNDCSALPPVGTKDRPASIDRVFGSASHTGDVELCLVPAMAVVSLNGTPQATQTIEKADPGHEETVVRGSPMAEGSESRPMIRALVLHGSGFQYDRPDDNAIWINGERRTIDWSGCADAQPGAPSSDTPGIHGQVVSRDEIRLCDVELPANGQLRVAAGYGDTQSAVRLYRGFSMGWRRVAGFALLIAVVLALLPLGLLWFVRHGYTIADHQYRFRMLFLDPETSTYSLSKLQFYLWTNAAIFGYAYLFISRVKVQHAAWPDVPGSLPGIIAVAGGTAVGAQIITTMKGTKGAGEDSPSLADFITSGGLVATDRLQMFVWTLFGVGAFFYAVLQQGPGTISDLPALPERLLSLMGLSSAGYLAGKIARKAGPVINEISVTPQESDAAIAARVSAAAVELPDLLHPIVDAQAARSALPAVINANAKAAIDALASAVNAAGAAHTTSELNALIADLGKWRSLAETAATNTAADFVAKMATAEEAAAAQQAAAALQDFSAGITEAISIAAAAPMLSATALTLIPRTIDLRGTGLSADGLFQIDHVDLPFRMLRANKDGQNAPELIARDEAAPTLARLLRLTIDPALLATADLDQFTKWFAADGRRRFSLTNPDGQKAEMTFDIPPGAAPTEGATT